jgi:hypothetical protein
MLDLGLYAGVHSSWKASRDRGEITYCRDLVKVSLDNEAEAIKICK